MKHGEIHIPSSILADLKPTSLAYIRTRKLNVAKNKQITKVAWAMAFSFGGFSKLGVTPGGGLRAGLARICSLVGMIVEFIAPGSFCCL
jgi:hypothetical protein